MRRRNRNARGAMGMEIMRVWLRDISLVTLGQEDKRGSREGEKLPAAECVSRPGKLLRPYLAAVWLSRIAPEGVLCFRRGPLRGVGRGYVTLAQECAGRYSLEELRAQGMDVAGEDFPWSQWREHDYFGVRPEALHCLGLQHVSAWVARKGGS